MTPCFKVEFLFIQAPAHEEPCRMYRRARRSPHSTPNKRTSTIFSVHNIFNNNENIILVLIKQNMKC